MNRWDLTIRRNKGNATFIPLNMKILKWCLFFVGYLLALVATPMLSTLAFNKTLCWKEPVVGSITAALVVIYSYVAAPQYKQYVAVGGYLLGVFFAYQLPDMHRYPECHKNAYMQTWLPLILTYAAGLMTLLIIILYSTKRDKL